MAAKTSSLHVYLLAGVKTSPSVFHACSKKLDEELKNRGMKPAIHVLFPYGDANRSLLRQVMEVRSDLSNRMNAGRVGGRKVWNSIKDSFTGDRMLLIGHSGGGAAAYQAARLLKEADSAIDLRVVQVGSPKTPIVPEMQENVSYFHSVDTLGKLNDPISKIGSWGGWTSYKRTVPVWNRHKYAPGYVEGIPVMGGHADYFRHEHPYIDQEMICNLDKTLGRMKEWLKGWL